LQEQRALKELPAVQAGAQDEMSIEERAGLAEKRKKVVAHVMHSGTRACGLCPPRA